VSRIGTTTRDRTDRSRRSVARGGAAPVTRLPSRTRGRRPARRRRPLQLAVGLLVLATVVWALWASPVLGVRTVQVDGVSTLPAGQVRETVGLEPGTSLLRVDVQAAEERVARLPQVASVEVTRGWPNTVVVTVVERVPVAIVGEAGARSLVDADGVLFDTVTGAPPPGVVPLDVPDPGPDDPATRAALAAMSALPADVRAELAEVSATSADDVSLTLADGTSVSWGGAEESAAKAAALAGLIEQIASGGLEAAGTIDVSAPHAVVLR
jgi:cell division protein FtsQ